MPAQNVLATVEAPIPLAQAVLEAQRRKHRASQRKLKLYYADPVAFVHDCVEFPEGQKLCGYQEEVLAAVPEHQKIAQRGPHGLGKDLDIETPIPTPTGWTTMLSVKAGDVILDEQGRPTTVTYAEEPRWREAHKVTFSDGSSIIAGSGHLWSAIDVYDRPTRVTDWREHWDATKTLETQDIAAKLRSPGGQLRWRVPTSKPLDLPEAVLPIDPYLFGAWLGDGTSKAGNLTACQADIEHLQAKVEAAGWTTRIRHNVGGRAPTLIVSGLHCALKDLGVFGAKHIPITYLRASVEQRRELVRGLWDTDGYHQGVGADEITLTNKTLVYDVLELLHSLGLSARIHESDSTLNGRVVGRRWRIGVRFDFDPYTLERYDWRPAERQVSRHTQRTIVSVEPVGRSLTKCIAVDSPRHLFLAGEAMIPTHNTTTAALLILWFALTREAAEVDWKCPVTAGAWRQLEQYLWPEVWKWARHMRWDKVGREPFRRGELLRLNLNLPHGSAFAVASDVPALIEGAHADSILYVFDESKAIVDGTFDAAEGAFSGAGIDGREAFALASSTPGEPIGRFYDINMGKPGYEDWWARHVTLDEAVRAGRINRGWAETRGVQWGTESQLYANRVLGEFHASDVDAVIPLSWIEAANRRWEAHRLEDPGAMTRIGVDVATSGADKTMRAPIYNLRVGDLLESFHEDTVQTATRVWEMLDENERAVAVIDADGVGVGVFDQVRKHSGRERVRPFKAAEKTDWKDASGELGFINTRAAAWWYLRQQLDPANHPTLELPPDDALTEELMTPKRWETKRGLIQVESKDEVKKRLAGRSTDRADAVIMGVFVQRKRRKARMVNPVLPRQTAVA